MSEPERTGEMASDLAKPPSPKVPRSRLSARTLVLLVALAVASGFVSARLASPRPTPAVVQVVRPTADVITAVRQLARLETASFHVERVVDLHDQQRVLFGVATSNDAILLIASGDVVAGVDLAKLRPEDVVVDAAHHRVRITLPPAEIFSARLDNDRTYVYQRETELFARRSETLETRARQEAERTMRAASLEGGILARAGASARSEIGALVRALGYHDVEVVLRDAER